MKNFLSFNIFLFSALLVSAFLNACSSDEPNISERSLEIEPKQKLLIQKQNDFGIDFFKTAAKEKTNLGEFKNFSVSPISASLCLNLVAEAADDPVKSDIANVLGYGSMEELSAYNGKLQEYLNFDSKDLTIQLVNNIWFDKSLSPNNEFTSRMKNIFGCSPQSLDFTNTKTSANTINSWASDHTKGNINKVVEECDLRGAMSVFANALFFKSDWENPFDSKKTTREVFRGIESTKMVDMMKQDNVQCFYRMDQPLNTKYLGLPFKDNETFMLLVLPDSKTNIFDFAANISNETLSDFIDQAKCIFETGENLSTVSILLPRFKTSHMANITSTLASMGISLNMVTFKNIGLDIDESLIAKQFTSMEVNEQGSTAAAVTIVEGYGANLGNIFNANHPFLYFIIDTRTSSMLMAGIYAQPE